MDVFMKSVVTEFSFKEGRLDLNEVVESAYSWLEALVDTEFYQEYGKSYVVPEPRLILIDDKFAVYAQPDLKSVDNKVIYDVKTFDPNNIDKARRERAELEMRVFQLAYPGSKAVILGFPLRSKTRRPVEVEYGPLKPREALVLLGRLRDYCSEKGERERIDFSTREVVAYTLKGDGYDFEVYEI